MGYKRGMATADLMNNRWLRRLAWAIGSLLVLWGCAWLAVPPLLKSQVQKLATEQLGRKVTLGAVDFKPWSLELTLTDLAIATADGASDQVKIQRLYIDSELQSVLRLAPVVDALAIDAPQVRLTHLGGGRYDIDDIVARLNKPSDKPPGDPPRFALYNLALAGGSIDFTDKAVDRTHQLRDLAVGVPFLSNLESHREVNVEPRLAFKLNGSGFDSAGQGTPFTDTRKSDARVRVSALDLAPYLGYLPAGLPVRLVSAVLSADLKVAFEQKPQIAVRLTGTVQADGVKLATPAPATGGGAGADLLSFDMLRVALADVRPLQETVHLSLVELEAPRLAARRDAAGRLNLAFTPAPAAAADAPKNIADNRDSTRPKAQKDSKAAATTTWKVSVDKVALRAGRIGWTDETTPRPAQLALEGVTLDASAIALPFAQPLQFSGAARLVDAVPAAGGPPARKAGPALPTPAPAAPEPAGLTFSGQATDSAATVTASLGAVPLSLVAPYLATYLEPALTGGLAAELGVQWAAEPAVLQIEARKLTLSDLALRATAGKSELASIRKVEVQDARVDVPRQAVTVGKLVLNAPRAKVERSADGRWMFERWLKMPGKPVAPAVAAEASAKPEKPAAPEPVWKVLLGEVSVGAGAVAFSDQAQSQPVAFDVSNLTLLARNFSPDSAKPAPLNLSARVGTGRSEPGRIDYQGTLAPQPLAAAGQLTVNALPVHAFEPYFGDALNIELLRADASFKGQVRYADTPGGPALKLAGDVLLEEFRANSVQASVPPPASGTSSLAAAAAGATTAALRIAEELLNWKALSVRGLEVSLAPGSTTLVDVKETVLSDFFARVIINESGRINLQDLVKSSAASGAAAGAATAVAPPPAASQSAQAPGGPVSAEGGGGSFATNNIAKTQATTGTNGQNALMTGATGSAVAAAPPPIINVGPVSLVNGRVFFSDRFVRPNYSANLSELTGKLSAFSSVSPAGSPQLADLELRGRAEGTASLEILGKLNPLAQPLALDITGKVRDLELPPLSPYSVKYAGHGIERGKMSVDVSYKVEPSGQLTASNNIVLNQLTFGEKVEGAPASLPVRLAVALLADRNGVIDINLPISGSLNDPQFSLGPVIFKVIVNLIVKAITSPFSLLASAFGGGGDELSMVAFAPGSALLGNEAKAGLDKVAKALTDRPALRMTVVGTANLEAEREGYKRERLRALLAAEKRRASVVAGQTATAVVAVSDAEAPALLKEVYRRADMPKPRNLVGMAKDIPPAEMEALLLASIPANDDVMRELALQRGVAVKDYLASKALPVERLFLGAAKSMPAGASAGGAADAKWSPRAELNLATN